MSEMNNEGVPERLQRLVETIDVANLLTDPLTRSIESMLRATAADLDSEEASVLIRDGDEGDLKFLCAIGKVAEQLADITIPAGKGIAGFVLSSGQPMAVANVEEDKVFYREVDKATGYSTELILATPLRHGGEVIGVLEYINRAGDPPFEPFTPEEMDRAGRFAEAVASMVNAYESAKLLRELGEKASDLDVGQDLDELRNWLAQVRTGQEHREMMDIAVMVREIASRGDAERAICHDLLEALLKFTGHKTDASFLNL